jgi:hypothetical protein
VGGRVICTGARREEGVVTIERATEATALEQLEHVPSSHPRGCRKRRRAIPRRPCRIGTVVEKELKIPEGITMPQRVVQRPPSPVAKQIGIGSVRQKPGEPVVIVPVHFAKQHRRDVLRGELAALHQDFHGALIEGLWSVVGDLSVVRIGPTVD